MATVGRRHGGLSSSRSCRFMEVTPMSLESQNVNRVRHMKGVCLCLSAGFCLLGQ